eukprot:10545256-Lingulodinium_polyedra.AAC.1
MQNGTECCYTARNRAGCQGMARNAAERCKCRVARTGADGRGRTRTGAELSGTTRDDVTQRAIFHPWGAK